MGAWSDRDGKRNDRLGVTISLAVLIVFLTCPLWLWGVSSLTGGWYTR